MKVKIFSVLLMLCAFISHTKATDILNPIIASQNNNTSKVISMAMDASGNTYVLQNLFSNASGTDASIAGYTGSVVVPVTGGSSSLVIDKITAGGATSTFAVISILPGTGSGLADVHGSAIGVDASGRVYLTGHFKGTITYQIGTSMFGPVMLNQTSLSNSYDVFAIRTNVTTGYWELFNQQGGTADEYADAINVLDVSNEVFVAGHYNWSTSGTSTSFTTGVSIPATTAANALQNNCFLLRYSFGTSTFACSLAGGWATLASAASSVTPHAITARNSDIFFTGEYTGNITLGSASLSHTTVPSCPLMVVARYDITSTYDWAQSYGNEVSFSAKSSGNAMYIEGNNLMVAGSIAEASTTTTHVGAADAYLMRLTGTSTLATPNLAWNYHMGSKTNDEILAIANDGLGYVVSGNMSNNGSYTFYNSGSTVSYTGIAGQQQGFVARFTTAGALTWLRYGQSSAISGSAVATTGSNCYVSFGGNFNTQSTWNEGTTMGTASPSANKLYVATLQKVQLNITATNTPFNVLNNGTPNTFTASGATSYSWLTSPFGGVTVSNSAPSSATTTLSVSGGTPSTYFDLYTLGYYTWNTVACTTATRNRIIQTTTKTDGSEVATSIIDDANQPMLTFSTFPNPTTNKLTISYSLIENAPATLQAIDVLGRVVYEKEVNAQYADETIDTDLWGNGAYIVSLQQNGKVLASKNVLKQ